MATKQQITLPFVKTKVSISDFNIQLQSRFLKYLFRLSSD